MLALVNTPSASMPVALQEVAEPAPTSDEAIVEVRAFSINRGELALLATWPEGWRPGQDIAGIVVQAAADGSGPKDGLFDLILESVGGSSLADAISKVAPNGTIVVFGNSSRQETSINFSQFAGHAGAGVIAFFVYSSGTPASMGADLATLVSLVAAGKLIPEIGLEDSWQHLERATAALRDRKVNGKAILHIDETVAQP